MSRQACIELAQRIGRDPDDVIEWWLERAAVREFDGGMARADAEAAALADAKAELDPMVGAITLTAEQPRRGPRSASSSSSSVAPQIELPFGKRS